MTLTDLEKKLLKAMRQYDIGAPEFKKNWSEQMVKKIVAKRKLLKVLNEMGEDSAIYFIHKIQRNLIGVANEGFYTRYYNEDDMNNWDFDEIFIGHWISVNAGMESSKSILKYMPK